MSLDLVTKRRFRVVMRWKSIRLIIFLIKLYLQVIGESLVEIFQRLLVQLLRLEDEIVVSSDTFVSVVFAGVSNIFRRFRTQVDEPVLEIHGEFFFPDFHHPLRLLFAAAGIVGCVLKNKILMMKIFY